MRDGSRSAAAAWIDDYAKRAADQIEEQGGIVQDEEHTPDGWEELCKHPATQQQGETLALIVFGLAFLAFLYFLFTNPRILLDKRFGILIGLLGLLTLVIAAMLIFTRIRSALRKLIRRRQERV